MVDLASLGPLIAARRNARGLTVGALASAAGVGRSTLAALESGKLPELGFNKVARICAAAGILLDTHPPVPVSPQTSPGLLTDSGGRALTSEAVKDIIEQGDFRAWQDLADAVQTEASGRLAFGVRRVVGSLRRDDPKVAAFVALLPAITRNAIARDASHPPRLTWYRVKLGSSL